MVTTSGETRRKGIMLTSTPRFLKEHMDAGSNPVLTTLGCNSDEPTPRNKSQQQHTIVCRLEQMKGLLATIGVSGNEYRLGLTPLIFGEIQVRVLYGGLVLVGRHSLVALNLLTDRKDGHFSIFLYPSFHNTAQSRFDLRRIAVSLSVGYSMCNAS